MLLKAKSVQPLGESIPFTRGRLEGLTGILRKVKIKDLKVTFTADFPLKQN